MSDDSPLIEQADALMRRYRVFLAGASATSNNEIALDDVPVLTDIVSEADDAAAKMQEIEADAAKRLAELMTEHRARLSQVLEAWLDEQLPLLLTPLIEGLSTELVARLRELAREDLLPRLAAVLEPIGKEARGTESEHEI